MPAPRRVAARLEVLERAADSVELAYDQGYEY